MSDAELDATDQAELDALLKPFIERLYPQTLFAPPVSADQVLAALTAIEERYLALDALAQALLCAANRQLLLVNSHRRINPGTALFLLGELAESLGLTPATAKEQVYAALQSLAGLQIVLSDATTLRSFTVVWRSSLRYSEPDEDYLVTLVLGKEVVPLLRFAASIQDEHELLPDWLRCDE